MSNLDQLEKNSKLVSKVLGVLANSDRLMLLCYISQGEYCVGDLEEKLDIKQPTLSQQLGVLRRNNVVKTRRDGKQIYYSLSDAKSTKIINFLHQLYCA